MLEIFQKVADLKAKILEEAASISDEASLKMFQEKNMSKKSELNQLMGEIRNLEGDDKTKFGQAMNDARNAITEAFQSKQKEINDALIAKKLEQERLAAKYGSTYNIGDTITTSKYEITVKNIEERTKVGVPKYYKTVDDYYYTLVCATIEMKNTTNEPQRIYDYRPDFSIYFKLEDENERIYYNDSTFTTYYQYEFDNFNYSQFTINAGETVTVTPVFKMDKSKYQNKTFYMNVLGELVKIQ